MRGRHWIAAVLAIAASMGPLIGGGCIPAGAIARASGHVQKAERVLRKGKLEDAAALYRKALRVVDALPEAHIGLGNIAMREGRYRIALEHYERARGSYVRIHAALETYRYTEWTNAQSRMQEIRDKILVLQHPATSRGDAGYQISKLENEVQRLESFRPLIGDVGSEPPVAIYFYLGNAYFRLNRLDEAVEAWETCVEGEPRFAVVFNNLALAYWKKGEVERARNSLLQAEILGFTVDPRFKADLDR
jgi:tetratricopeptide (TPR) repeat protein